MPEPKKQSSPRKTGMRRSHLRLELARRVNKKSPVKAFETKKKTPRVRIKDVAAKAGLKAKAGKTAAKDAGSTAKKATTKPVAKKK